MRDHGSSKEDDKVSLAFFSCAYDLVVKKAVADAATTRLFSTQKFSFRDGQQVYLLIRDHGVPDTPSCDSGH